MSSIRVSNPTNPSIIPDGVPADLPGLPLDPKSHDPIVKEAVRLHAVAVEKTANIRKVRDAQAGAVRALQEASRSLQEMIVKGATSGQIDPEAEMDLSMKVSAAERLADPSIHSTRSKVAIQEQRAAVARFREYVAENAAALYESLRPEAEAATAGLVKAEQSIQRQRAAAQRRSQELGAIVASAAGPDAPSVSQLLRFGIGSGDVPMPSDDALERLSAPRELIVIDDD